MRPGPKSNASLLEIVERSSDPALVVIKAQPNTDILSSCVDLAHLSHLMTTFLVVVLVDAEGIDSKYAFLTGFPQVSERLPKIVSN